MMLAIVVLLAACAPRPAPVASLPAPAGIAMERNSWGRLASRWTIDAAGNGRYTVPEPDMYKPERMVTRGFSAGGAGFAEIRALLGRAQARAGGELECGARITDQFYGMVQWDRASLRYDMGCQAPATQAVLQDIVAAERRVAGWAANQPILETRKVESQ